MTAPLSRESSSSSVIKAHIRKLAGSGDLLEHLIIERNLETAFTEYSSTYAPPSQHVIVAPTCRQTELTWNREMTGVRTRATFTQGDLILNPSCCFTRPQWDRDTCFTLVAIKPGAVEQVCDELEAPSVEIPMRFHFKNGALVRTIQRLMACVEREPPLLLEAQTLELSLVRQLVGECRTARNDLSQLSKIKLNQVREMIRSDMERPITLKEMAAAAGYSPSRFLLLFRNATGYSPHQYLMRERVEKARDLVMDTRVPLGEVAATCGFTDQSHLIRSFKRHTGFTPGEIRN